MVVSIKMERRYVCSDGMEFAASNADMAYIHEDALTIEALITDKRNDSTHAQSVISVVAERIAINRQAMIDVLAAMNIRDAELYGQSLPNYDEELKRFSKPRPSKPE